MSARRGFATRLRLRASALLVVSLLAAQPARADVEPMKQSLLFLRVLAYDRNLRSRAGEALTLAVLRRAGNAESEAAAAGLGGALNDIAGRSTVAGLHLKVTIVDFKDAASLEGQLGAQHVAALFLTPGLADALPAISALTRRHAVITGCGAEALVRSGISIGVVERDGHPALIINLPASRAEGADLDAAVLRLAEVIR